MLFCSYYINLCQEIHGGLTGCPDGAAVCRRRSSGKTETLGRVFTQSMRLTGQWISTAVRNTRWLFCNKKKTNDVLLFSRWKDPGELQHG